MYSLVASINNVLWGHLLVYLLLIAGVWFSVRLKFVQLGGFGHMFALLKISRASDGVGISSFQALCTSLSARVGTGNLAGVAIAISVGGPGAVFWMWVIAFLGMATAFAESLLAQVYKVHDANGEFRGGPAYYIYRGLGSKALATVFSVFLLFGYTFVFNATQANTIADALNHSYQIPVLYSGLVITIFTGIIVLGGLRSVARFSEWVVPTMAAVFLLLAVVITAMNFGKVPALLWEIIRSAFGWQEAAGATFAAAVQNGIKRGLYSNEAGAGSVPQAAAAASPQPNHPATQGYIQMLGVFIDTMIICTCTALIIMLAGDYLGLEMTGIRMTQNAMAVHLGEWGQHFVALAITLFAFTSILGNYAYAESNLHFFKLDTVSGRVVFTCIFLGMTFLGTQAELKLVWAMADMSFGLMAVINVVAITLLTPTIVAVSKHYADTRRRVLQTNIKDSVEKHSMLAFKHDSAPIQGKVEQGIW